MFNVAILYIPSNLFLLAMKHVYYFSWTFKWGSFESGDGCTSLDMAVQEEKERIAE